MLLGDTWALARAGERTIADVLALASGLGTEVEPAAWERGGPGARLPRPGDPVGDEHRELLAASHANAARPDLLDARLGARPRRGRAGPGAPRDAACAVSGRRARTRRSAPRPPRASTAASSRATSPTRSSPSSTSMRRPGDCDELLRRCKRGEGPPDRGALPPGARRRRRRGAVPAPPSRRASTVPDAGRTDRHRAARGEPRRRPRGVGGRDRAVGRATSSSVPPPHALRLRARARPSRSPTPPSPSGSSSSTARTRCEVGQQRVDQALEVLARPRSSPIASAPRCATRLR